MDEILNLEETLKDQHFAFYQKDVERLTTEEGCPIQMENKVYSLDDEACSDGDESGHHLDCTKNETKIERMKREFLSLTLNANRDPIERGENSRLAKLFTDELNEDDGDSDLYESGKLDDGYSRIHKRYRKLGSFEELINKEENFYEPLSESKLVFKRRLLVGSGPLVSENSIVIYNCAFWTEGAKDPFDSTWLRYNTFVTDLSTDSILPGLRDLLLTTKKGEWAEAFIRPEAAFGPLGALPRIPPNATIFCLLEVSKVIDKDKIALIAYDPAGRQKQGVSFEDFYAASDEARRRGNHYHDKKQYKVALQRYKSGVRILEALTYKDQNEENRAKQLLVKLYNNTARAANASNQSRHALWACKQASLLDNLNPKTHWNRMIAWKTMGHLDKALGSARRAMQSFSDPKTFRTFEREAEVLKKEMQVQQTKLDDTLRAIGRTLFN